MDKKKNAFYSVQKHNRQKARATATFISVVVIVLIIVAFVYALFIRPNFYRFNGGEAEFITTYSDKNNDDFVSMSAEKKYIYECSKNGLTKRDLEGTNIWSKGFYFENPQMIQEGDYVAVADITGKTVHVFDKDGYLFEVRESYPIIFIDINEYGFLTTVMEKDEQNLINYYNNEGDLRVTRNTQFVKDGYPISVDTSSDVTKMATGFLNVSNNRLQSNISFFGFEDQYDSYQENIIGAFSYENSLINFIKWLDNTTLISVLDNGIYLYNVDKEPVLKGAIPIAAKIIDVQATQKEIIIHYGDELEFDENKQANSVIVYDFNGKQLKQFTFDEKIKKIAAEEKTYYIITSSRVIKFNEGRREWFASTYLDIKDFYEVSDKVYIAVTDTGYEVIKLREK